MKELVVLSGADAGVSRQVNEIVDVRQDPQQITRRLGAR
jgi:hypothetical protein